MFSLIITIPVPKILVILRPVTSLKWLPDGNMYGTNRKLIAGTADGRILCIDLEGKLFAAVQVESSVLCLDTDGKIIAGGCADGSVRVWMMQNAKLQELCKFPKAHSGAVTAISIGTPVEQAEDQPHRTANIRASNYSEILVSGSDDCSIRVWRIGYEK